MASKPKADHSTLLKEINERFRYASDEWADIQAEGAIDMRYIAGDPWEPRDKKLRIDAGRPCLALDELNQYVNQLINEIRQHKRAIQVTPIGTGADDDSARIRADLIRQIEYRSNAQQAYTTMFENTVQRSYGFLRIIPKYVHAKPPVKDGMLAPDALDQELFIEPVVNPDLMLIDPDIQKPDGSDMGYAFELEYLPHDEFHRKFPHAEIKDFNAPGIQAMAPAFFKGAHVLVAGYWRKHVVRTREVLHIQTTDGPQLYFADELAQRPSDEHILNSGFFDEYAVERYVTNGVEILKKEEWKGQDIPIVCCFGKVLYLDQGDGSKRTILSMIRLARDPYMLYCVYRTAEAEQVGMSTKFPYFVRRGSLKPDQLFAIAKSLHEPVAAIQVETSADGMPPGTMPEMPVRNPFEPAIQALEIGAEGARRAIQAAIGQSPLPSSAQRRNEKSGVALKQIDESAQKGSYHFIDHYEASVTRAGAILNDLLPHYYDTPRDVTVRGEDDTTSQVRINDPNVPEKESGKVPMITEDQHDVTLSTGPSYDSERELASEFTDTLVQNLQTVAATSGQQAAAKVFSLAVKLKNLGPIGNQIADTIAPPESEQQPQIPPQLMQQMQMLQAENQQLRQLADKNLSDLKKAQISAESDEKKAHIDGETRVRVAGIQAEASAYSADVKAGLAGMELRLQQMETLIGIHADASAHALDHLHERRMAELGQQHAIEQSDQAQRNALEQGEQGQAHAIEQLEAQPQPEAGA